MSNDIVPAGQDRGERVIPVRDIIAAEFGALQAFEAALLEEARRRKLEISWREDDVSGDIRILWRPDRHAEITRL